MTNLGGDPNAMRGLAAKLGSVADRLEAMQRNLSNGAAGVPWVGDDANRFRNEWNGRYVPAMHKMAADLRDAAGQIRTDAVRQDQASRSDRSGGW